MKHNLSAFVLAVVVLALAACDKDGSKDPAPTPTTTSADAAAATPLSPAESAPDGGRRDLSDGGYYPGKSTKPM